MGRVKSWWAPWIILIAIAVVKLFGIDQVAFALMLLVVPVWYAVGFLVLFFHNPWRKR